ncbi:hypothetical protein BT96DRAFT_234321 [Gymnopus androsaceus JB14]|uniref:Uncharacterized protein n=1 Tax=Gymnopus androsaceus JB14 TaxID=1447944 RepID=A0A6A4ILB0_9AGAR|nr:hypothetical protein BT96DRAFT_234321 [Gymnopus androsaceus JB14]
MNDKERKSRWDSKFTTSTPKNSQLLEVHERSQADRPKKKKDLKERRWKEENEGER